VNILKDIVQNVSVNRNYRILTLPMMQPLAVLPVTIRHFSQLHVFLYKHLKIRNHARLCWAVSDFEPQIMRSNTYIITVNVKLLSDHESVLWYR